MAKAVNIKYPAIKFPTGAILYLDGNDTLKGSPEDVVVSLSKREVKIELNAFEVFLKGYIAAGKK